MAPKRFQTGREIMRVFVPGYEAQGRSVPGDQVGVRSGTLAGEELARSFEERLGKKKLRVATSKKTRN